MTIREAMSLVTEAAGGNKKKAEEIRAALKKSKANKKKDKAPKETIDSFTEQLLRKPGGVTLAEAKKEVVKKFGSKPNKSKETLEDTTSRRIKGGYLAKKLKVKITKDDNGKYSIVEDKKKGAA